MSKKTFKVPASVTLTDRSSGAKGQLVSFADFIRNAVLSDSSFAGSFRDLKQALRIDDSLSAEAGADMVWSTEDWEKVKSLLEKSPGHYGMSPLAAIQLLAYIDAVVGATDVQE